MCYALREALSLVCEEGLEKRWARHRETAEFFWGELAKIGLKPLVDHQYRLPSLTTIIVPEGVHLQNCTGKKAPIKAKSILSFF